MVAKFNLTCGVLALAAAAAAAPALGQGASTVPPAAASGTAPSIGRYEVFTIPFDPKLTFRSGTYTPSGKVLVSYAKNPSQGRRHVMLATQDDDGRNFRPFFSQVIPERPKDNGLRFMVLADNKRIFTGDHIVECKTSL